MARKPLETGIECYIGRPGSGKSFVLTRRSIQAVINHRRPVYTNLPLKWRCCRRLLRRKGGEALAGLIHPLSEDHFNRFMQRFVAMRQFEERYRADASARRERVRDDAMRAAWLEHAGPDYVGPNDDDEPPNWIPPGAIVCIDEVHHWFPNPGLRSVKKQEPPELLSYLTMHRHCQHMIWLATQAERQISQTVWSNSGRVWVIHPRDDDKLVWFLRMRHLGIKALGYQVYSREQYETDDEPMRSFSIIPGMPWHQWVFKCYNSFTHVGSLRHLNKQLAEARSADGVEADGRTEQEKCNMAWQRTLAGRWFGRLRKLAVLALVFLIGAGWAMSRGNVSNEPEPDGVADVVQPEADSVVKSPGMIASITSERVRMDNGLVLRPGQEHEGWNLRYVDEQRGAVLWLRSGTDVWVQYVGQPVQFVGESREVVERFGGI